MRSVPAPETIETLWPAGTRVNTFVTTERYRVRRTSEMHRAFEVNCLLAGAQDRYFLGYESKLLPGEVCLSPAWEPHGWRSITRETTILSVHFVPELLGEKTFDGASWLSMFACAPDERPRVRTDEARRRMLALVRDLRRAPPTYTWYEHRPVQTRKGQTRMLTQTVYQTTPGDPNLPPAWEETVGLDVLRVLVALYQIWEHRDRARSHPVPRLGSLATIMPAVNLVTGMDRNLRRVSLQEAARSCSLSATHFLRLFHRTMGITFGRFELRHRLAISEKLLRTTDLSVQAIADQCAFADASHLHRHFVKAYGERPAAYRAMMRRLG
jgi:AraC-like DNA-binding protein